MTSSRKKFLKRAGSCIILTLISYLLISMVLTKVVYDHTFVRYDDQPTIPSALTQLTDSRQAISFDSGENTLQGYLYPAKGDGLIVLAPGYRASCHEYLWQIRHLTEKGWGVFCYDPTGSCESEGDSAIGFSQAIYDLCAALDTIEANGRFGYKRLYLFGHSRGAYAVCGALDNGYDITAAVSVSGVNSCMEAVIQPVADKIGVLAYGNYPFLWLYQTSLFGKEAATNGADVIQQSGVPTLVVQGSEDAVYPPDQYSLYAHAKQQNPANVTYYLCETDGQNGHTDLLFAADGTQNKSLMDTIDTFLKNQR